MSIRDDADLAVPRCPRCTSTDEIERLPHGAARRWWCGACNLACDGTTAEHRAESQHQAAADAEEADRNRRRLSIARGELS